MTLDQDKVQAFLARYAADQAATMHAATVVLGDRLGLYRALADDGPQTPAELAHTTGYHPRLVEEWLNAQAVSGYCVHDPSEGRYGLTPEQAACLADETSPVFVAGGMLAANAVHRSEARVREAFAGDGAVAWAEHPEELFTGVDRSFRTPYAARLVPEWVPALDGVEDRLRAGARVADVGCGYGTTTVLLAEAFPNSTFAAFDTHALSIARARKQAADAEVSDRVTFEVAAADEFGGRDYDLVCLFNVLHELGDPAGAIRHIRDVLVDDGTMVIVEPNAGDTPAENRTPFGRSFSAVSTLVCVPNALAQGATEALGAQAPDQTLQNVTADGGFARFQRVAETPMHRVLEVRP